MLYSSKKKLSNEDELYNKIINFSRNKFFYDTVHLEDHHNIRIYLIFFHISFLMFRFKDFKKNHPIKIFLQKLFNYSFKQIEANMREFGYGDVTVNKNMKILVKVFYNIIFDFESYSSYDNRKKSKLFNKYLPNFNTTKKAELFELIKYFNKYQSFCLDLPTNSVIEGELNFKY